MRRDYSYSYEWDREYCYPNSNVLINKMCCILSERATAEHSGCLLSILRLWLDTVWIFHRSAQKK